METSTPRHQYDVALSFAGEDRSLVEKIANDLKEYDVRVFYDEFFAAELWGKDLFQHFASIYRDKAKYCLVFVSQAYRKKAWPRHELRQAQERSLFSEVEYILPVLLDEADLPGLNRTTGYIDARTTHPSRISYLLLKKLGIFDDAKIDRSNLAKSKRTKKITGRKVKYDGVDMISTWPSQIQKAQPLKHVSYHATILRIPYGQEFVQRYQMRKNCHNCAVRIGQVHVPGCTVEVCPLCGGQLISCDCPIANFTSERFVATLLALKGNAPPERTSVQAKRFDPRTEISKRFRRNRTPRPRRTKER